MTLSGAGVSAIDSLHFGINVDWTDQINGKRRIKPHMTIAYYAKFPEAIMGLSKSVTAICLAVQKSTRNTLKAVGIYQPGLNPRAKSCIYTGPVEDALKAARRALDDLAQGQAFYQNRMLVPHVDVSRTGGQASCPSTYEFDFSQVYYYSPDSGHVVISCQKRTVSVTSVESRKGAVYPDPHLKAGNGGSQHVTSNSQRVKERRERRESVERKTRKKKGSKKENRSRRVSLREKRKISGNTSTRSEKSEKRHRHPRSRHQRGERPVRRARRASYSSSTSEISLQHIKLKRPRNLK